jgi:hypothetical protein
VCLSCFLIIRPVQRESKIEERKASHTIKDKQEEGKERKTSTAHRISRSSTSLSPVRLPSF